MTVLCISCFGQEDVEISDAEILEEYIQNSTLFPFFGFVNPERTRIDVTLEGVLHFFRDVKLLHDSFLGIVGCLRSTCTFWSWFLVSDGSKSFGLFLN